MHKSILTYRPPADKPEKEE